MRKNKREILSAAKITHTKFKCETQYEKKVSNIVLRLFQKFNKILYKLTSDGSWPAGTFECRYYLGTLETYSIKNIILPL